VHVILLHGNSTGSFNAPSVAVLEAWSFPSQVLQATLPLLCRPVTLQEWLLVLLVLLLLPPLQHQQLSRNSSRCRTLSTRARLPCSAVLQLDRLLFMQ
jgi:hypothetical protein